jgi:hypothetical protein
MATVAHASQLLIASTTLVSGSESAVYSFNAPGPGTVSVQLTNLDWPQALSSLNFMATTANQVLSSWSDAGSGPQFASFQVASSGTYFADISAVAAGPLDLGLYSLSLEFTPAVPVPLPASGGLLLIGAAGLMALLRPRRVTLETFVAPLPPHATP